MYSYSFLAVFQAYLTNILHVPTPAHTSNFSSVLAIPWLPWQQSDSRLRKTGGTWKDPIFTCTIYSLLLLAGAVAYTSTSVLCSDARCHCRAGESCTVSWEWNACAWLCIDVYGSLSRWEMLLPNIQSFSGFLKGTDFSYNSTKSLWEQGVLSATAVIVSCMFTQMSNQIAQPILRSV